MPDKWSDKHERMYEDIKDAALQDGKPVRRAKEIAARTVNKARRLAGVTDNATSQGTGNPNARLEDRTVDELYNRAKQLNVEGRSNMRKAELIEAIRERNG